MDNLTITVHWRVKPGKKNDVHIECFGGDPRKDKQSAIITVTLEPHLFRRVRFEGGEPHILPAVKA